MVEKAFAKELAAHQTEDSPGDSDQSEGKPSQVSGNPGSASEGSGYNPATDVLLEATNERTRRILIDTGLQQGLSRKQISGLYPAACGDLDRDTFAAHQVRFLSRGLAGAQAENARLRGRRDGLQAEVDRLHREVDSLRKENDELRK